MEILAKSTEIKALTLQNQVKEEQIANQKKNIFISLLIMVALSSILFLFYQKNKFLKESIEKSNIISKQNEKLKSTNEELKILNKQISEKKMELEGELRSQVLMGNNIKTMLDVLQKEIETADIAKDEKRKLRRIIDRSTKNTLFDEIDYKLLKTNEPFFARLSVLHPNLTQNDLMLCALIKMNLSSKEIAELQYKEVGSIKMAKTRLKKKIEEDGKTIENLTTYLNSIILIKNDIDLR